MDNKLLQILHKKIQELGPDKLKELLPAMHSAKFNSIVAGSNIAPENVVSKVKELWPEEFIEQKDEVQVIPGNIGVNQLNFTILTAVHNTYDPGVVGTVVGLVRRTGCGWMQRAYDGDIYRSRNYLAAAFLKSDYEWSFWLDADTIVPNGNSSWYRHELGKSVTVQEEFLGLIAPYQLASHNKYLVSGVYFDRHGNSNITAGFNPGTSLKNKLPHRSLLPARYCGFGCVMIHRKVYEDILKKYPELWDGKSDECQVFSPYMIGNRVPGEDEMFCIRAKEVGHDTFLDLSVVAGHAGRCVNYIPSTLRL